MENDFWKSVVFKILYKHQIATYLDSRDKNKKKTIRIHIFSKIILIKKIGLIKNDSVFLKHSLKKQD